MSLKETKRVLVECDQPNAPDLGGQRPQCANRDCGGLIRWKSIGACRDGRKRNGGCAQAIRDFDRAAIAGGKRRILPTPTAVPDRTHRVDDPSAGEVKSGRRLRVTCVAPTKFCARFQKSRAPRPVNGTVDSPASQ